MRVERILDESRQLAPAMTRARWAMLVCCAAPVIYLSAVMRPARVHAQQPPPAVSAPAPAEVGVEEFQANVVQLNSLQRMLEQNREALNQVLQRRVAMESELQNLNSATRAYEREAEATALEDRLRRLQAELATLQETFSPQHPSVRRLQTQLAEIERMRAEMARTSVAEPEKQANLLRAEMQNLNRQMDEKVKQAAEIQRQIAAYQQRVESAHSGTVLTVTFGADGRAEKVRVVHGHGPDQDEKAIEWAKGLRNGQPGPAVVTVEVPVK